jgi:hypothetical protein
MDIIKYLNECEFFNKTIVFDFNLYRGGIGDYIKYFIYLLELCIQHRIKLYYLKNNIMIEKYIPLKYHFYVLLEHLQDPIYLHALDFNDLNINTNYIVNPHLLYNTFTYDLKISPDQIFDFHPTIVFNSKKLLSVDTYISVHVRLGDKFLEIDKNEIQCYEDVRMFDEPKLFKFIEDHSSNSILLFSDNHAYKLKLKELYPQLILLNTLIGHTALNITNEEEVIDTITEFYIMTNSTYVYSACDSGFSIMASKFKLK